MVLPALLELLDSQAHPDHKEREDATEHRASLDQLELMVHQDPRDNPDHQDPLEHPACPDLREPRETLAAMEHVDHRVSRV